MEDKQMIETTGRRAAVSVADAARLTGSKADTLRARLRRGSLDGYQNESGEWYVYRDVIAGQPPPRARRGSRVAPDPSYDQVAELRARIAELERDREWLRQQVERQTDATADALAQLRRLTDQITQPQLTTTDPHKETDRAAGGLRGLLGRLTGR